MRARAGRVLGVAVGDDRTRAESANAENSRRKVVKLKPISSAADRGMRQSAPPKPFGRISRVKSPARQQL